LHDCRREKRLHDLQITGFEPASEKDYDKLIKRWNRNKENSGKIDIEGVEKVSLEAAEMLYCSE